MVTDSSFDSRRRGSCIDEVMAVTDEDAFVGARRLAREEGIFAGVVIRSPQFTLRSMEITLTK